MALCAKVEKENAEAARRALLAQGQLDISHQIARDESFVYFPVLKKPKGAGRLHLSFVQKRLPTREVRPHSLKDALAEKLTAKELEMLVSSFDIIGTVAIIEVPSALVKHEKEIAHAIMRVHQNVKTVAKKISAMQGAFRVRKLKVILGRRRLEAEYCEHGVRMLLDASKVYFSPRLATERGRILQLVKPREKVMVMFAGVGPFALVIAKGHPDARIVAVELNPVAVAYMKKNIARNKMRNIKPILGDVRKVVKKYRRWAHRIAMPLPHNAEDFLDCAFAAAAKGCIVHFYAMAREDAPFAEAERKILDAAAIAGRKTVIANRHIVRPYAPHVVQVAIDFEVK